MVVLFTYKYEDRSNLNPRAGYSTVLGRIRLKFDLIQAFIGVRYLQNEEDRIKNKGDRVLTTFLPL